MAHFAQLDGSNNVIQVIVVTNSVILDENGVESEDVGIAFCRSLFGDDTFWKQTSYNASFRKNYAGRPDETTGIPFTYDPVRDAFLPPHFYPSWTLNEETCQWTPPTPYPLDGKNYSWNEQTQTWDEVS